MLLLHRFLTGKFI